MEVGEGMGQGPMDRLILGARFLYVLHLRMLFHDLHMDEGEARVRH